MSQEAFRGKCSGIESRNKYSKEGTCLACGKNKSAVGVE